MGLSLTEKGLGFRLRPYWAWLMLQMYPPNDKLIHVLSMIETPYYSPLHPQEAALTKAL
jgi:hypothetical protein